MAVYLLVSAIIFIVLGLIWGRSDIINFIVKVVFVLMGLFGFIFWVEAVGYITKTL